MLGTVEMIPKIGDFAKIGTDLLATSIILAAKTGIAIDPRLPLKVK